MYCFSQEQVASLGSSDHFRRTVCNSCGTQLLPHCLHSSSQRKLRPPADLSGEDCEGYFQVHGHLHHGVPGLHDWNVQPLLLLPWCKIQPCFYNVSTCRKVASLEEFSSSWSIAAERSAQIVSAPAVWGSHIQLLPGKIVPQPPALAASSRSEHRDTCRSEIVISGNQNNRSRKCFLRCSF